MCYKSQRPIFFLSCKGTTPTVNTKILVPVNSKYFHMFLHSIGYNVSSVMQLSVEKLCFNKSKIYTPFVLFSFTAVPIFSKIFFGSLLGDHCHHPLFFEKKKLKLKFTFFHTAIVTQNGHTDYIWSHK